MHRIKKFAASAALVALSVVGLAACGGESPTPTTALPTATTASAEAPTATTAAMPTATTATSADATATTGTGSGGTGSDEALDVLRQSASAMRDVKSYHIESADEVAGRIEQVLAAGVPEDRLTLVPDCGFSQTARWATKPKLRALVEGRDLALGRRAR